MAEVSYPGVLPRGGSSTRSGGSKSLPQFESRPIVVAQPHSLGSRQNSGTIRGGPSFDEWSPTVRRPVEECSSATLENARYKLNDFPRSDHDNEDRHFVLNQGNYRVLGIFDGHDGARAAGFASNYMMELFDMPSWIKVVSEADPTLIPQVLTEFFKTTEREFFKSIEWDIEQKEVYTALIPEGMTSYQAHQLFPMEVAKLQELEPRINGGTTAVLAVMANNNLYVANVGDSRAILIFEKTDGTLGVRQLSVDHGVDNEDELNRLEALGLNRESLKRAGRVGTQENTRSIGDYYIKRGYKNVDILASARGPPGIATPHVSQPLPIDDSFRYLVLMSDGVYKSIEGTFDDENVIESNKVLTSMIQHADKPGSFVRTADHVIDRLSQIHHDSYQRAAIKDIRSPKAVNCRKRDDMTCIVYKFPPRQVNHTHLIPHHQLHPNSAPSSLV